MAFVFPFLISLKLTIERLLRNSDISLDPPTREIAEFAYKQVESLEQISKRMLPENSYSLAMLQEAICDLYDAIESQASKQIDSQSDDDDDDVVSSRIDSVDTSCIVYESEEENESQDSEQIYSQSESSGDGIKFSIDQSVHFISEFLKEMEKNMEEYPEELLYSLLPVGKEEDDAVSSRINCGGHNSEMVGLSDQYEKLKKEFTHTRTSGFDNCATLISVIGMPGIGKTTLAKKIFEDPQIVEHFDCRVWVTVGRRCQFKDIPRRILAQLNPNSDRMLAEGDENTAHEYLKECLKGKRCLIVLDDVWDRYTRCYFIQSSFPYRTDELTNPFPYEKNGSQVLLTSRLHGVTENSVHFSSLTMRLLNKEESWVLLREKVFAKELCPPQLEKAGKKIAENCDGLPLTIITVADLLSREEKTVEYWSEVAKKKNHQLFMNAYDEISKVLLPSYEFLPRLLQICFLYMGIFPQNYEISRSKLFKLWKVDGFPELNVHKSLRPPHMECLEEIVSNSLVTINQRMIGALSLDTAQVKTCSLHSSLWHLSNREARKTKFFHALNTLNDSSGEGIKSQRRLSFRNNMLFGMKDVYKSVEDNCASTALAILCYGPYHRYPVPMFFNLEFLTVLDGLTIRFYEFPMKVLQLVKLKYLALTLDGKLPASISQLSNLQVLIVDRHISIKSCGAPSYTPVEIWNMKELQHLQVMGSDLPDPCGASLESLLTLSNVSASSCTEAVLKSIPNLEKLVIQIEFTPDNDGRPLSCFHHISHLKNLISFKCVIVNPEVVLPPDAPSPIFPSCIKKLNLSGLGYPWSEMSKIASLPHLEVLKLRNYAFRGPKWVVKEEGFRLIHSLVIEDTDLVDWEIGFGSFRLVSYLSIKNCYKLEKIPRQFHRCVLGIELVDCNPLIVEQMMKIGIKVEVRSSWE